MTANGSLAAGDARLLSVHDLDLRVAGCGLALLERVRFDVAPGELVALRGPSGCGKTLLLRAIAGLDDPAAGRVRFDRRSPDAMGWPVYRRTVLLVQQQPVLRKGLVRDSLTRPFMYSHAARPFHKDKALALLNRVGLGADRFDQEAHTLSVGEQQRVCLVRALLLEPPVLVLDEPTSALDEDATLAVEATVRNEVTARGGCALIVSHSPEQARRWCDRAIDLRAFAAPTNKAWNAHATAEEAHERDGD